MKISNIIEEMRSMCKGDDRDGNKIDLEKSRDKVLYGDPSLECTGIVVTCCCTVDVIKKAIENKANFIVCHESLFWNRGDKIDWLSDNQTFLAKEKLLKEHNIVVYRQHDFIHSGIKVNDYYADGIFYGIMSELGFEKYLIGRKEKPLLFEIPEITVGELSKMFVEKFNLTGLRIIGNKQSKVRKLLFGEHIMGMGDNDKIYQNEKEKIDCVVVFECVDFTLAEYIKDSSELGYDKSLISMGHFNTEELGMKYYAKYLSNHLGNELKVDFVQFGDMFGYITK